MEGPRRGGGAMPSRGPRVNNVGANPTKALKRPRSSLRVLPNCVASGRAAPVCDYTWESAARAIGPGPETNEGLPSPQGPEIPFSPYLSPSLPNGPESRSTQLPQRVLYAEAASRPC
eukprot:9731845-Alexandrium_andersonii.AAC.1